MKLGAFLKQYLKQSLQVFKHPKQMLPTIILTVVWIALGILQIKLKESLPMKVLNFLTYAQGGLYGGIFGAIGGILGKVVVAAFVNALIVPLFMGKKPFAQMAGGWKELLQNIGFQSKSAVAPLLKGFGAALLIYILFNTTARLENSMAGIMAAVSLALAMGKKSGFMWELAISYANTVSKGKKLNYQSILRALTGMTLGFALAVALTAVAPNLVSLLGIVALIVGWIMGKGTKKEAVSTMAVVLLCLLPQWEMRAQTNMDDLVNAFSSIIPDAPTGAKGDDSEGVWVLKDIKTEVKSEGTRQVWFTPTTVYNLQITDNTKISFDFREEKADGESGHCTSTISPVKGPYAPGEELCMNFSGSKEHPDITAFGHICALWDNVHGIDNAITKQGYCCLIFPHPDDVFADHFEFTFTVTICDAYVSMKYIFEWDEATPMSLQEISDILWWMTGGEGEHAPEEWTIAIAVIGGFGGAIGAGLGGGVGGGSVPGGGGEPPLSPEEQEWLRWQKEVDDRRKRYVKDNPDGTRTVVDPATGKEQTLYPNYGENGEQSGWKNENDTPYSEESLDEWLDWRERNSSAFAQDNATAEWNRADQRAQNDARNAADAERGSSTEADKHKKEGELIKAQRKREDYVEKIGNKYLTHYKSSNLKEQIKAVRRDILSERNEANKEYAGAIRAEGAAQELINQTQLVQDCCDTIINVGATMTGPAGARVRDAYNIAKGAAGRGSEAFATGGSVKDIVKSAGAGAVEGSIDVLGDHVEDMVGLTSLEGVGKKATTYAGQSFFAGAKAVVSGAIDGKTPKEIVNDAKEAAAKKAINNLYGELVDAAGNKLVSKQTQKWVKDGEYTKNAGEDIVKKIEKLQGGTEIATTVLKESTGNKVSDIIYDEGGVLDWTTEKGREAVKWTSAKKQALINTAKEYGKKHGKK